MSRSKCSHYRKSEPSLYVQWHQWAEMMSRNYYQVKCSVCGRYKIWKRKRSQL